MPFFWFSTANIGVLCSFWWKLCLKPKYTLSISSHHSKFHQNRATGLGFLLHTADASWLFFKCQYRGDPDFQSRSLLKTEQSLSQDLPPHKISGKLVVRQKSFTPYATVTDRQTDALIGSGLGSVGPRIAWNLYLHLHFRVMHMLQMFAGYFVGY